MRIRTKMKQKLGEAFRLYFILVTLITILLMVVGLIFDSGRTFSYEAFFSPLFYAFIGVIPVLLIEAAILLIVFKVPSIPSDRIEVVISIAVGILIVYILSLVVEYIFELTQAREMNAYLEEYQKNR